eukprot:scaffold25766_cov140-Isochrysis_galbana.AAC.2
MRERVGEVGSKFPICSIWSRTSEGYALSLTCMLAISIWSRTCTCDEGFARSCMPVLYPYICHMEYGAEHVHVRGRTVTCMLAGHQNLYYAVVPRATILRHA